MATNGYDRLKALLFSKVDFTEDEWLDIAGYWHPVRISRNEYLCQPGEQERYLYYVVDGAIRIYYVKDEEEVTVAFSYTQYFAGEVNSFLSRKPAVFHVQAVSDCQLLRISYDDLQHLYDKYRNMERWGRLATEAFLVGRNLRDIEMLAYTAEERYLRMWQQSPHCFQLFAQKHLASYLGMSPETFSRIKAKLTP